MNSRSVFQPLALIGFTLALTLFFASCCDLPALLLIASGGVFCLLTAGIFAWCGKAGTRTVLTLLAVSLGLMLAVSGRYAFFSTAPYAGHSVSVSGKIRAVRQSSRASYLLKVQEGDLPAGTNVLIYAGTAPAFAKGETVQTNLTLSPDRPTSSQLAQGADLTAFTGESALRLTKPAPPFQAFLNRSARRIRYLFRLKFSPKTAEFLTALFFGEQSELPASLRETLSLLGLPHILCISGLHIHLLMQLLLVFHNALLGKGKTSFLLSLAVAGGFILLTGSGPSAVRAWIMSALSLTAFAFQRDAAPLNSLGAAVLVLCLANPRTVMGAGFWLSVLSCWTIFTAVPAVTEFLRRKFRIRRPLPVQFLSAAVTAVLVNLGCLPVYCLHFGRIPWNSLLPNLLLLPLLPLILAGSVLALLPLPGTAFLAGLLERLLETLSRLLTGMAEQAGYLPLGADFLPVWLAGTILLGILVCAFRGKRHHAVLAVSLSVFLLAAGCLGTSLQNRGRVTLSLIRTESGQSAVLEKDGRAIVIGCGGPRTGAKTAAFLRASGVKHLDAVLVPQETRALMSGVPALVQNFPAEQILSSAESNWAQTLLAESPLSPLTPGRWKLWDSCTLQISRRRGLPDIGILAGNTRILLQSARLDVPRRGWDLVIFYDEIPQKDVHSSPECAIIENIQRHIPPGWEKGCPLFGENFAAECRYFCAG